MNDPHRVLGAALLGLLAAGCSLSSTSTAAEDADTRSALLGDVLAGRYAELADDAPAAADRLMRALRANPADAVLMERAIAAALAAADVDRALAAARLGARSETSSVAARLVLAVAALEEGRAQDAIRITDESLGFGIERLSGQSVRAIALADRGRTEEALAALEAEQRVAAAILSLPRAMVLERAGRAEEALEAYAVAGGEGVGLAIASERRVRLLAALGRRDEAVAAADATLAIIENPQLVALRARLASGGELPSAPDARTDAGQSLFGIAIAFLSTVEPAGATPFLALAHRLDPASDVTRIALAESLSAQRMNDRARMLLATVPEASPYRANALVQSAAILDDEGRLEDAIALLEPHAAAPDRAVRRALADLYRRAERWGQARALYAGLVSEADAKGKPDWRLYFSLGATLERMGDWPAAEPALQRALALAPDQPDVMNYLGYSWVDRGERLDEAFKLIERAVALRPRSGQIVDSLGWAHFKRGAYEEAVTHLERAVALAPDDPTINDHLGDAYWRTARRIEARFQWRRALTLDPAPTERAAIEAKLAAGLAPQEVARGSAGGGSAMADDAR